MKDHRGNPVTPHVRLFTTPEAGPPWRPAGWWAMYWSAGGFPNMRGRPPYHLLQSCRTRAEALVVLDAALADVAADLERYAAQGWYPRGVTPPQRTRAEVAAAALAAMARRRAEYAALLADPDVMPADLPPAPPAIDRDPDRWRYRNPPSTLTFREDDPVVALDGTVAEDGGWYATWTYACINKPVRRTDVGPFPTEAEARAYAANRWRGRRVKD